MTSNSFRQEAWNDRVVDIMPFNRFILEAWKDRVVETMTFNKFKRKPGMIGLQRE
jgi:hypothetical protein